MEKKTTIKIHILFWAVIYSITLFDAFIYNIDAYSPHRYFTVTVRMLCNILTFYSFYWIVSRERMNRSGFIFIVIFEILFLAVFGFIFTIVTYLPYAYIKAGSDLVSYAIANGIKDRIFGIISYAAMVSVIGILAKVSLIWYRNQVKQKEREKQNISNELAMLKAQVNPHFLFNTLNNIKSLTKSSPPKAVSSIGKLTDIMQYMLYDSSADRVPLSDEIEYIKNYFELERIRYSNPGFIEFDVAGDFRDIRIPPLIFMPFVENAFKHGNRLSAIPGISIKLHADNSRIKFEAVNYKKSGGESALKSSGFGLANIKRRLDLLFENKYELDITDGDKLYKVNLNLIIT